MDITKVPGGHFDPTVAIFVFEWEDEVVTKMIFEDVVQNLWYVKAPLLLKERRES